MAATVLEDGSPFPLLGYHEWLLCPDIFSPHPNELDSTAVPQPISRLLLGLPAFGGMYTLHHSHRLLSLNYFQNWKIILVSKEGTWLPTRWTSAIIS